MGLDIEFGTDIDPKKPVDVWLCGLAAASNDLLVAVKNYLDLEQTDGSVTVDPNLVEVHQAEKRYYFRLASAHSCEALKYISLDFDKKDFLGKESSKRTVQTFIDSLATATRCKYKKLLSYCSGPHSFQDILVWDFWTGE